MDPLIRFKVLPSGLVRHGQALSALSGLITRGFLCGASDHYHLLMPSDLSKTSHSRLQTMTRAGHRLPYDGTVRVRNTVPVTVPLVSRREPVYGGYVPVFDRIWTAVYGRPYGYTVYLIICNNNNLHINDFWS
jgi:hypothetical protein